jgi:hypothetical protein
MALLKDQCLAHESIHVHSLLGTMNRGEVPAQLRNMPRKTQGRQRANPESKSKPTMVYGVQVIDFLIDSDIYCIRK